jgi:phage terminase large subunit-like protein
MAKSRPGTMAATQRVFETGRARELSLAEYVAMLPRDEQDKFLDEIAPTPEDKEALLYNWDFWKRPSQTEPEGNWGTWAIFSGRGSGKTRIGSQSIIKRAKNGPYYPMALIGQTKADTRDTMVELFESSIMKQSPPWFVPKLEVTKRRLTWPNGMQAVMYSGDEPDQLRGPQHGFGWLDELAKFKYPQETWDNFSMGLRLGPRPQALITTTPRPIPIIKDLADDPDVVKTISSTYDNISNLPIDYIKRILSKYENTRLGAQEIYGKILGDVEGALWTRGVIEENRVSSLPPLYRVIVGVDPPTGGIRGTAKGECGIVVAGLSQEGHAYVLDDASIETPDPNIWAKQVISAFSRYGADKLIAEGNQGGQMVKSVIHTVNRDVPVDMVFASKGKYTRAEPIASLYSQGRVHHVGMLSELEDQMASWLPGEPSPDRLDALVWALTELMMKDWQGLSLEDVGALFDWTA